MTLQVPPQSQMKRCLEMVSRTEWILLRLLYLVFLLETLRLQEICHITSMEMFSFAGIESGRSFKNTTKSESTHDDSIPVRGISWSL